jgi:hypothetical protein
MKRDTAVIASTTGYCQGIFLLQCRHRRPSERKLTIGISSQKDNRDSQEGQIDRFPKSDNPTGIR